MPLRLVELSVVRMEQKVTRFRNAGQNCDITKQHNPAANRLDAGNMLYCSGNIDRAILLAICSKDVINFGRGVVILGKRFSSSEKLFNM